MPRQEIDRTRVTFSQAEGLLPLPSRLALGELSKQFRSLLWASLFEAITESAEWEDPLTSDRKVLHSTWRNILRDKHVMLDHEPLDEFTTDLELQVRRIKALIFQGPYNQVFDFLQFLMRHPKWPARLTNTIRDHLECSLTAYAVMDEGPTIVPATLAEEAETIAHSFQALADDAFSGARAHLRKAAEFLSKTQFEDSVRESISAVESVVRVLSSQQASSLKPALDSLAKNTHVHPAFKKGLENLYGYTSDETGIRHSLLEEPSKVRLYEAQFMIGACAAFISYLVGSARAAGTA